MTLDDIRYRAIQSRDTRFDGTFFTAVTTTGIYCRPVCPARTPHRKNVRFFSCAAAAEAAGFRPCHRCRPETAPGSPAWRGTATTVTRALRYIQKGYLDTHSLEELATILGMGPRQLTRLFDTHVGAPPGNVARTRRLHFARILVTSSDLSMTQVAFNSGFASIRRFNESFREAYGLSPTLLRESFRRNDAGGHRHSITLRLNFRPPYAWDRLIAFLEPREIAEIETVHADRYTGIIRYDDGTPGTVEVAPTEGENSLTVRFTPVPVQGLASMVERARTMFDLDLDPGAVASSLESDPALGKLITERPGLRIPGAWSVFEFIVRAILGQQVSVRSATTTTARLVRLTGTPLNGEFEGRYLFPTAAELAAADLSLLPVPESKRRTLGSFAKAVAEKELDLDDPDLARKLTGLPGIGPWTAAYTAMRALSEPDILPSSDLVLRKAVGAAESGVADEPARTSEVDDRAEAWRPWRSYATMYLWDRWL